MKILQARSGFEDNGPGTQALTISRELRDRGYEVIFAAGGGDYLGTIRDAGFDVALIPAMRREKRDPATVARAAWALRRLIRERGIAVVHAHNAAAALTAWAGSRLGGSGVRLVHSVRGIELRASHRWRNWIYRRYPAELLAVSQYTRDKLLEVGADSARIRVSYNGVDTRRFDPDSVSGADVRRKYGLGDGVVAGHVGSMKTRAKGQHVLIRALGRLRERVPDLRILLVGDGVERPRLEELARAEGVADRVVFVGRRFDAERFHAVFDVYAQPSVWGEMFPNSILEAMAMATPWVGSRLGGLAELTANGRAGTLVEPGDVDALADALQRLALDPRERAERGSAGRAEVRERFSVGAVVDGIVAAYTDE
ncbi:MAG: glycosyltransferase [Gemmatimonadota bacterium]